MGRGALESVYSTEFDFEVGKSIQLRDGGDVTLIAYGIMVAEALKAADVLAISGLHARVINMHTVKPLDEAAVLKAAADTGCIVTAEEHNIIGGLGEAVAGCTSGAVPVPVIRVGINDIFCGIGPEDGLRNKLGLTAENIVESAKKAVSLKRK
jgi:transketolase